MSNIDVDDLVDSLTGGRSVTPSDRQFLIVLLNELDQFQYQAPKDRALMFHPLGGYQRYLIHQAAQTFPKLTSFSIGDDKNRRTVVCFKSKKKEQQSVMAGSQPRPMSSPRSDYMPSPHRSKEDLNRGPTPISRSRESSRSRKKHDDIPRSKTMPRNSKPEPSHLPRPLRAKKASTKREQLKRSRSLQSSPVHPDEPDAFLTDGEGRRGRRRRPQDKRPPRSSSLKAPTRRRVREESPVASEAESRSRKSKMRHNISDASLHRRTQGLKMEGRVMNGDIEDPYSCGDSESDAVRVDAEAVYRHRRHNHFHNDKPERSRSRSIETSDLSSEGTSEDSQRIDETHHKRPYNGDDGERSASDEECYSDDMDDDISVATVEHPPSYKSLKRNASLKKVERNLSRIKRSEHGRSTRKGYSDQENHDDVDGGRRHESRKMNKAPQKKSSTMPRSMKEPGKKESRRSVSTSTTPRVKTQSTQSEPKLEMKVPKQRKSSSGSKPRSKSQSLRSKQANPMTEVDGLEDVGSVGDLDKSNSTLYIPLPGEQDKKAKNKKSSSRSKPLRSSRSTPSSPTRSTGTLRCCDGETQTDVSGTLSRKKKSNDASSATLQSAIPPWQDRSATDVITSMMQFLGIQPQGIPQAAFNPMPLNAFHQFLQNNPLASSHPPFPPHMLHQLYMSWLGAYYAGATGTWPPPFMTPSSNSTPTNQMPSFEPPPSTSNPQYPRHPRHFHESKDNAGQYYDQYYPSSGLADDSVHHPYPHDSSHMEDKNSETPSSGGVSFGFEHKDRYEEPRSTQQNYSNLAFDKTYEANLGSRHVAEDPVDHHSSDHLSNISCQENGRRSNSVISTDCDTDASSILSVNKKGDITVASHSKGGVMVYVSSQPNSRTSSTADTHESINTSDNNQSLASTPRTSERGSQYSLVEKKIPKPNKSLSVNRRASKKNKQGNHDNHSSDSSYDADQSRAEDTSQSREPRDGDNVLLKEADGDVVVQDPQFDYYNWKPNQDTWNDAKYKRFVEIFDVSAHLTDIEITSHLTKYRGLRLSRVDYNHALCMLPSGDVATELLNEEFSSFQIRPLSEATEATKKKAMSKLENEDFEAIRATRPKTDASVAKRLIAGSLGNSKHASPSGRRSTKQKRSNQ